jgi:hypothetical protein
MGSTNTVLQRRIKSSTGGNATVGTLAGMTASLIVFAWTGPNLDMAPLILGVGSAVVPIMTGYLRFWDLKGSTPYNLSGKIKFRESLPLIGKKEKRTILDTFGVRDHDGDCLNSWVKSSNAVSADEATHIITHYSVSKGAKFSIEQEVKPSTGMLWDSSLDAVEEFYNVPSLRITAEM